MGNTKLSIEEHPHGYDIGIEGNTCDLLKLWGVLGYTIHNRIFKPGTPAAPLHLALDAVLDDMQENKKAGGFQEVAIDMSKFKK